MTLHVNAHFSADTSTAAYAGDATEPEPEPSTPPPTTVPTTPQQPEEQGPKTAILSTLGNTVIAGQSFFANGLSSPLATGNCNTTLYEWNFGDVGSQYNALVGFNVGHIYDRSGTYEVRLNVTDANGTVSFGSTTVTVLADTRRALYVSTTGNDSNPGTQTAPFKTILKASKVAKPGTTVHVASGTYAGGIQTVTSGTATARIRYVSDVKWGAKIVPAAGTTKVYAWDERGSYVDIVGFDIDGQSGMSWRNGLLTRGSHNIFKDNHVHHIADKVPCESSGGSAIGATHYEYGVQAHVINNVVHHIGYTGCKFIQGIYMSTSGTVKNNLVYAIGKSAIQLWHDANNVIITNNTVFGNDTGIKVGGGDFYHNTINDNTHVSNNIIFDNLTGIAETGVTGTNNTYTNNLVFKNTTVNFQLKNGNTHTGTISADPQFVNYHRTGGGDYRLRATSPAIDKGSAKDAPSSDIIRTPRPQYGADDIGAYEYR